MKELNFEQMEELQGGVMKAGCVVAGVVTTVSAFFIWSGIGAIFFGSALLASAAMGCFENA